MNLRAVLEQVPDPRGKQGQDYRLWSILSLIAVSLLCGRRGLRAAFLLGRSSNKLQRSALGFVNGNTPCHATLTRAIDGRALADPEEEVVYLNASLPAGEAAPEALLCANRGHWGIESAPQAHTRRRFAMN